MTGINLLITALIYIFPAYVANSSAVFFGGGKPIDLGKTLKGRRILGDGKTFRGFGSGLVLGTVTGLILSIIMKNNELLPLGFLLSLGAVSGDLAASFFKRRIGLERGEPAILLDQLDFAMGAVLLGSLVAPPEGTIFILIVLITPAIHLTANGIGYLIGLKDDPW